MKPSSLYGHLAELIAAVSGSLAPADAIVRKFFRDRHYIGSKERRWLSTRIFGVIRHRRLLEHLTSASLRIDPGESSVLPPLALAAAYATVLAAERTEEIVAGLEERWTESVPAMTPAEFLGSVAEHQRVVREPATTPEHLALQYSFPDQPVREWVERLGQSETEKLLSALNTEAPLSIRVNTLRCTVHDCAARLKGEGVATEPGVLSPFALRLPARSQLESLPSYREGWFEVQDEGSQLLSLLLRPEAGARVIDACAGAGGKTMHLAALLNNQGALIAIDPDAMKLKNLRDRAIRAGVKLNDIIEARHDDPALERLRGKGDGVLVDAPCSGLGTVRRNPWLKSALGGERETSRSALQRDILRHAAMMVRPGGRLVYSTCTLVRSENEDVVEEFLRDHDDFSPASAAEILKGWGIGVEQDSLYLTLWPQRNGTDGFFAAVMHRAAPR